MPVRVTEEHFFGFGVPDGKNILYKYMNFLKTRILVLQLTKNVVLSRKQMYAFLFEQYYQHHLVAVQELHTLGACGNTSTVWEACLKRGKENQNCKKNQNRPRQKRLVKDA